MCVEMIDLVTNESLNELSPSAVITFMLVYVGTYSACKNFKDSSIYSIFINIKKFLLQPNFRMFSAYFGKLMP